MCIFRSMISLKKLLKQLSEPVCFIQHQSKYWHNSKNAVHPFVEWESEHCISRGPVVSQLVISIFIGVLKPPPFPHSHHLSWSWKCRIRKLGKVILGNSDYRGPAGLACLARCAARHMCWLAEMLSSQKFLVSLSVYCSSKCPCFLLSLVTSWCKHVLFLLGFMFLIRI